VIVIIASPHAKRVCNPADDQHEQHGPDEPNGEVGKDLDHLWCFFWNLENDDRRPLRQFGFRVGSIR